MVLHIVILFKAYHVDFVIVILSKFYLVDVAIIQISIKSTV